MMKKREQSLQTKEKLLGAAQVIFAKSGFDSASVASICEAAGVSKGAFYHHFESKQALFFELMKRWLDDLEERLHEIEAREADVPEKLFSMAHVVGDVLQMGGPQLSIYLEFWNQAIRDRDVHRTLSQPFDDFIAFFSGLLEDGMERGTIKSGDAEMTARVIIALGIGLLFQGLLEPGAADWNEATAFGLNLLFEGLYRGDKS
ncbi:MAG: TetR/AcrR family transcriptional regulator [Anaerolineales bacterium]|nr:TetR/AcrR family transcriptional regulator [Anaerolineales bacterium]